MKNFTPCLCKNWLKKQFLLLERSFSLVQLQFQNNTEPRFGQWMSETNTEEMEGKTAVVPSLSAGRDQPGKVHREIIIVL